MSTGAAWWTWEDLIVRGLYAHWPAERIAALLQTRTGKAVRWRAKVIGVRKGERHCWTKAEDALLRKLYAETPTRAIANRLHCSVLGAYQRAHKLGLKKSDEFMERMGAECGRAVQQFGLAGRFQKGLIPHNKGVRRPGYAPGRMAQTQFKKGSINGWAAKIVLPVGTVKFNPDGYLIRKIDDKPNNGSGATNRNWEFVHRRVWEDANGPIPPGHRIWWKDGNHGNCALENLELLSDAEHMARTTIHNLPPKLKQVIMLTGALKRKIRNRKEKLHGQEQDRGFARPPVRDAGDAEGLRIGQAG